jgi:hypothetical protein
MFISYAPIDSRVQTSAIAPVHSSLPGKLERAKGKTFRNPRRTKQRMELEKRVGPTSGRIVNQPVRKPLAPGEHSEGCDAWFSCYRGVLHFIAYRILSSTEGADLAVHNSGSRRLAPCQGLTVKVLSAVGCSELSSMRRWRYFDGIPCTRIDPEC